MPPRKRIVRKAAPTATPRKKKTRHLSAIRLGEGLPAIPQMHEEIQNMTDILLGREEPPPGAPDNVRALMEVADAFYARASEMTMKLQALERNGQISRGSGHYKFRTGELRTFMDMAKRAADLGSRRITFEQLRVEAERTGRHQLLDDMDGDE